MLLSRLIFLFQYSILYSNSYYIVCLTHWLFFRSDPSMPMYYDADDEDTLEEQMMIKAEALRDPRLEQLSDEEIIDALELLERMKENKHRAHELSDREVR